MLELFVRNKCLLFGVALYFSFLSLSIHIFIGAVEHRTTLIMVSDHSNKRFCNSLGELAQELICWHTDDNKETRQAHTTYVWYLGQIDGNYMEHVCRIINLLSDTLSLERAGFAVTDAKIEQLGDDVEGENHFANFHGVLIMSSSGYRYWTPPPCYTIQNRLAPICRTFSVCLYILIIYIYRYIFSSFIVVYIFV